MRSLPCLCQSRSRRSAYDANNLSLGYCVTTHKSQGATVENTYVFLYGAMTDAQMAYVQVSRARDKTRIYTTDDEAGPELSHLTQAMSRDRRKDDGARRDRRGDFHFDFDKGSPGAGHKNQALPRELMR